MEVDSNCFATLLLLRLPQFGSARYRVLTQQFGSAEQIITSPVQQLVGLLSPAARQLLLEYQHQGENSEIARQVQQDINYCQQHQIHIISAHQADYPPLLRQITDAPMLLFVKGDPACLQLPQIAIVGSRNATPAGIEHARQFARELARGGVAVTSGLALGVDGAAHRGALTGNGKTIGVMGTGIDQLYPRQHIGLAEQMMASGGALVTELPLGTAPRPQHFPKRNRIISGLSMGVLVVEAALRSGSLITARLALEQNREVFAIPGSIHNPVCRGSHQLIKQGGCLVETAQDIIDQLDGQLAYQRDLLTQHEWQSKSQQEPDSSPDKTPSSSQLSPILECLGFEPCTLDELVQRSGISSAELSTQLVQLELQGLVEQQAGRYQRRR